MMCHKDFRIDVYPVSVSMKNDMSHRDFNIDYLKARTISDAKLLHHKEQVQEAKQKLAEYERNFEENMPKNAKLNKMKRAAKDAIEQNMFYDREKYPRSKLEEKMLENKVKDFETKINTDLSPLFDSAQKEQERIQRHKKAFETYKSYSFLKAGLQKTELEKKLTGTNGTQTKQYNFPDQDQVANVFINKDMKMGMLKQAEEVNNPGRKFKYTPRDFIEKYFGKDYNSGQYINLSDRPIYSFNDELKRKFPISTLSEARRIQENEMAETSKLLKERSPLHFDTMSPQNQDFIREQEKRQAIGFDEVKTEELYPEVRNNPFVTGRYQDRIKEFEEGQEVPFNEHSKSPLRLHV